MAGDPVFEVAEFGQPGGLSVVFVQPLGGVVGFDPQLGSEHVRCSCGGGQPEHRTKPVLGLSGGAQAGHRRGSARPDRPVGSVDSSPGAARR